MATARARPDSFETPRSPKSEVDIKLANCRASPAPTETAACGRRPRSRRRGASRAAAPRKPEM
eukprot:1244391-Heterocapsa_arctica.AAC.1